MPLLRILLVLAAAILASPGAHAQNVANGQAIYMGICIACHGFPPSGGPDRAAGNPSLIRDAINGRVPAMSFLRNFVDAEDIRDIAEWLKNPVTAPPPPPPPPPPTPAVPAFDFTDLWWHEAESGWGVNLIQHPSHIVFGVIYTYDASRRAMWFFSSAGVWNSPTQYVGDLYRAYGPHYNVPAFDSQRMVVAKVGTFQLDFGSRDSGTLTYVVDGVRVAKPITRQPF